jgi:hypothetical protein
MESAIIPNNKMEVIICDDEKGTCRPVLTCIAISGHKLRSRKKLRIF